MFMFLGLAKEFLENEDFKELSKEFHMAAATVSSSFYVLNIYVNSIFVQLHFVSSAAPSFVWSA